MPISVGLPFLKSMYSIMIWLQEHRRRCSVSRCKCVARRPGSSSSSLICLTSLDSLVLGFPVVHYVLTREGVGQHIALLPSRLHDPFLLLT